MDQNNTINWRQLIPLIHSGKCMPLISNNVALDYIFGHQRIKEAWANAMQYPLPERDRWARIAQYRSVIDGNEYNTKWGFLDFLKQILVEQARINLSSASPVLGLLEEELGRLTVSQVAARLGFSNFGNQFDNPFSVLANLPLPIYMTTSYHTFMEEALKAAGKEPYIGLYRWSEVLQVDFQNNNLAPVNFQPTAERPLVYHLQGLDHDPNTLVLTEANYFVLFRTILNDLEKPGNLPSAVQRALATSALLMLGYDLQSWSFNVLFHGLLGSIAKDLRPQSLSIQLEPDLKTGIENTAPIRQYLHDFFRGYNFSIYWGDVRTFSQELWSRWEA